MLLFHSLLQHCRQIVNSYSRWSSNSLGSLIFNLSGGMLFPRCHLSSSSARLSSSCICFWATDEHRPWNIFLLFVWVHGYDCTVTVVCGPHVVHSSLLECRFTLGSKSEILGVPNHPSIDLIDLTFNFKIGPQLERWVLKLGGVFAWQSIVEIWRENDVTSSSLHTLGMDPSVNSLGPKFCSRPLGLLDFWRPRFVTWLMWYMTRFVFKKGHQHDMCLDEIGLCAKFTLTILGSIVDTFGRAWVYMRVWVPKTWGPQPPLYGAYFCTQDWIQVWTLFSLEHRSHEYLFDWGMLKFEKLVMPY